MQESIKIKEKKHKTEEGNDCNGPCSIASINHAMRSRKEVKLAASFAGQKKQKTSFT